MVSFDFSPERLMFFTFLKRFEMSFKIFLFILLKDGVINKVDYSICNILRTIKDRYYINKDDEGLQSYTDTEGLLVPLYTEGTAPLIQSVSDTQLKNIDFLSCEEHHGPDLDVHIETFLSNVFNVAKQFNLSHACCCNVIQRKLTHTAKHIFQYFETI